MWAAHIVQLICITSQKLPLRLSHAIFFDQSWAITQVFPSFTIANPPCYKFSHFILILIARFLAMSLTVNGSSIPLPVLLSLNNHLWVTFFSCMISGVWRTMGFRVRMYIAISSPQRSAWAFRVTRRYWLNVDSFWRSHQSFMHPISYRRGFIWRFGWCASGWNHLRLVSAWSLWQSLTVERGQWLGLEVPFLSRLSGCISFLLLFSDLRSSFAH